MVKLVKPTHVDETLLAASAAYSAARNAEEKPRRYLGASSIGLECSRRLWYGFRGVTQPPIDDFSAIDDGHRGEDVIVNRINLLPDVNLYPVDADGNQFAVEAVRGHFRGHMDGAVIGLKQAPKTWHVFEAKVCNEKKFNNLVKLTNDLGEKAALEKWDYVYYAQAQIYMHLTGMERHWLVCATPGVRNWHGIRTEYNKEAAKNFIQKAEYIIESNEAPPKAADDPTRFVCKWCPFIEYCHHKKVPAPDCRNCVHATPENHGTWRCEKHGEFQADCADHVFMPDLVSFAKVKEMHPDENCIEYELEDGRTFKNGTRKTGSTIYSSKELQHTEPAMIQDSTVDALRVGFDGEIVDAAGLPRVNTDKPPMDWDGGGDDIPF